MNKIITDIEKYYDVKIDRVIEDKNLYSKVEFYKNRNTYSENLKGEIIKLNLTDNSIDDLEGFANIFNTITHINLAGNRLTDIKIISNFKNLQYLDLSTNNISDISPIAKLKKLKTLYLDTNLINKVPIFNSLELSELWLYNNEIEEISNLSRLINLHTLNLSNNSIKNIKSIFLLNKLENIDLGNNQIDNLEGLENLKNLNSISFYGNKLTDISIFSKIEELDVLNLSNNQIVDVSPLKNLIINKDLILSENEIFDLTPLYHSIKKGELAFINIFENPLVYPPSSIALRGEGNIIEWFDNVINQANKKITLAIDQNLTKLDLGNIGLTDLSLIPNLFSLIHLEELILSNEWAEFNTKSREWKPVFSENNFYPNNIVALPTDISNLNKLKKLIAGGDWKKDNRWNRWRINDVSFINKLDNIEFINVSNNMIEAFKITRSLNHLKTLHINNNLISSISISRANNIEYFFASNNLIKDLIFLKKSISLKAVDLHSNLINDLYPIRELIFKLGIINDQWGYDSISIANNSLENPGMEVVDRGKEAVLRIIKSNFRIKTFKNDEIKLILVGNSETGKTTLAKYLSKDTKYKEKHPFTLWMDILQIDYRKDLKVNIFDFGGHEYFHDTHHIFFTSNCIYFLIWDKSKDQYKKRDLNQIDKNGKKIKLQTVDYPLFYWLDSIKHFVENQTTDNFSDEMKNLIGDNNSETYNSSSLVIQNKVCHRDDSKFINNKNISDNYSFIYDFINIDFHTEKNLNLLNDRFEEMIDNLGILSGGRYPMYYKKIKENIYQHKGYLEKKILTFNEFKRLCQGFNRTLTTDDEFLDIAYFLQDIGLILISKDKTTYYLDLNFISNQLIKIYEGLERTKGILKEKEIKDKNVQQYENILKLIIDSNLAFEITKDNELHYVFPLFLEENPSKVVDLLLQNNIKPYKRIEYKGFMHKGIILHIFSEYSDKIVTDAINENTYYWKTGLIIKEGKNLVLIKFFFGEIEKESYIDIIPLQNDIDEEFIDDKIVKRIIQINKSNNYDIKQMVSNDGKNFIDIETIHYNEKKKNLIFFNNDDQKYYKLSDFKKYLKNKNLGMKKVFLSYSRQDLQYKEQLKTHLSILEKYGLLKAWSCDQITAGKWNEQIQTELEEADIIVYMVSANFMSSTYIMEDEVKKGIQFIEKNPEKKIICVLVGVCQWNNWAVLEEIHKKSFKNGKYSTMDLSQFQFLPYHQYKNNEGIPTREEIVALEKWGKYPYEVANEAYNQIANKILNEINY